MWKNLVLWLILFSRRVSISVKMIFNGMVMIMKNRVLVREMLIWGFLKRFV